MRNVCLERVSICLITNYLSGLKLANLHSMAVDYVKTGQPAQLSRDLKPLKWPHFMEKVGKQQHQIYTSKKVLGQLYDQVERVDFVPAFTAPFDTRILQAYTLDEDILQNAREIKIEYDAHMHRIMAQQEIKTEFEVWSTFVLQHSNTSNSFKYHEQIGEISIALKDQFRLICHERAGGKDYEHIGPFVAAMYEVTAREVTAAVEECHRVQSIGGQPRALREMTPSTMPLMSFPWLFQDILGKIAKSNTSETGDALSMQGEIDSKASVRPDIIKAPQPKRNCVDPGMLSPHDYLKTSEGTTRPGELLELFGESSDLCETKERTAVEYIPSSSISVKSSMSSMGTSVERGSSANDRLIEHSSSSSPQLPARKPNDPCFHDFGMSIKNDPQSLESSMSHLRGSDYSQHNQGRTEVAGLVNKETDTALDDAIFERRNEDERILGIEHDYTMPEGSNIRLLNDLMMGLPTRLDTSGDLESFSSEKEEALKDESLAEEKGTKISRLSKTSVSSDVGKDSNTEITTKEEKTRSADEEVGYPSDSDAESEEVILHIDDQARPLEQLARMIGD